MNRKVLIIASVIGLIILWNATGYIIEKSYHKRIRSKPKGYCYQTYWGPINNVLFVKNKSLEDSLIQYYQKIERGIDNPTFNFPPLTLPYDTCVYILGYDKDSMITKIGCYYNWDKRINFIKGYVYSKTLHKLPPADSLILKKRNKN